MKKITLFLSLLLFCPFYNQLRAQDLQVENFESFNVGNIAGQGGWASFSGVDSDYQITYEDVTQGNVVEITGPTDDATGRFLMGIRNIRK